MMDSHRDEIAKLETLYANNPEGRVFTHLAEAYRKGGQLDRAKEILEIGLQRHPDYASAHVVLGRVLVDFGDSTSAANEFRRVLELDRHNLVALRSLGDLARGSRRIEEALYYYGELAVLDPSDMGIQDEIRRMRIDLAETEGASPAAGIPTEAYSPEPVAEPAAAAEPATEDTARTESIEPAGEPHVAGADEPAGAVAEPAGWAAAGATDAGERASEPDASTAAAGTPDETPEAESLEGLEVRSDWADVAGEKDRPAARAVDETAFEAGYGTAVGGEADLSEVRLDPAFAGQDEGVEGWSVDLSEPVAEVAPEAAESAAATSDAAREVFEGPAEAPAKAPATIEAAAEAFEAPETPASALETFEAAPEAVASEAPEAGPEAFGAVEPHEPIHGGHEADAAREVPAEAIEADREPEATEAWAAGDAAHGAMASDATADEPPVDAGPEGPAELSVEESEARGVAWHEVEGRWTGDQPPSDPEAERRAALGDPGEWIPAERWEWVAASADVTGDEAATADTEAPAEKAGPEASFGEMTEETSFAGLVDESSPDPVGSDEESQATAGVADDERELVAGPEAGGGFGALAQFEPERGVDTAFGASLPPVEPDVGEAATAAERGLDEEFEPVAGAADAGDAWETGASPEPVATPEAEWPDAADDDEGDQVITETLAEIYASQGLYERAAAVYRRLVTLRPADDRLQSRLAELERTTPWSGRAETEAEGVTSDEGETEAERGDRWLESVESAWTGGAGAVGTADTPYAWTSEPVTEEPTGERIGKFFRSLLDWHPSGGEGAPVHGMGASEAEPVGPAGTHDAKGPESALDEWFAPSEAESAAQAGAEPDRPDGDEDLEMFRSWLKSLKK